MHAISQKKIFLLILAILIAGIFLFSGNVIKKRYFEKTENADSFQENISENENLEDSKQQATPEVKEDIPGEFLNEDDAKEDEEIEIESEDETPTEKEYFLDVKQTDCNDSCKKYAKDKEDFNYCQEFCGLNEIEKKDSKEECEEKEGLEEDYCLRDLAISKKDYSICEKIEDAGILKMCQNRITEDLFEEQKKELD